MSFNSTGHRHVRTVRSTRKFVAAALASAALLSAGSAYLQAGTTYSWTTFAAGTVDWATASAWTPATGYPGSDGTTPTIDDLANFTHTGSAIGGIQVVNISTPLPAGSIGGLTLSYADTSSTGTGVPGTSGLTLNVNSNLTFAATYNATTNPTGSNGTVNIIGGTSSTTLGKAGTTTLNIAQNVTFSTPGTVTVSGADSVGTAALNINGNYSAGTTQISDDLDQIRVNATAGTVNLGVLKVNRSSNNASITTANLSALGGLHLYGGNVTASSFLVGANNSGGVVEEAGSNLTISGLFIVGDYASATNRYSNMFQTSGNVNAANSTLAIAGSTGNFNSQGNYSLTGGTLNVAGIQLNPATAPLSGTDLANFLFGAGTMNVGSGGIAVGVGTSTFTSTGGGTIAASASWTAPSPVAMKLAGVLTIQAANANGTATNLALTGALTETSAGASIVKNGGGTLTLSGNNGYTGGTTVNAGKLIVSNTFANTTVSGTGTGPVAINNSGTILAGLGSILGNVTVASGAHIAPGNNSVGTLGLGNLALSSGAVLDFDFNSSANSLLSLTGNLTLGGSESINVFAEGTTNPFFTNGNYTLISATTVPSASGLSVINGQPGVTYLLGSTGHSITLQISGGAGGVGWAVDANGSWGNAANWNGGVPAGSVAILGNVLTQHRTVTLDGDRSITGLNFNSSFGYTIAQGSSGSLILDNGASTAAVNDFLGTQVITAPVILNSTAAVTLTNPTDTVTVSGPISGAGGITVGGPGTLILTNNGNTFAGNITNGGNLQVGSGVATGSLGNGSVNNSASLSFNSSSNMTIATTITGVGTVSQNGSGVLTLSGNNTYSGNTNINNGIVQFGTVTGLAAGNVNVVTPGKLDLNGLSVSLNSLSGNGTVDNLLAGSNATLNFNGGSVTTTTSIQNTVGNITVSKGGSGNLTFGGNSSYTGGTVTTGTATGLIANTNTAFGTGNITLNGSQSFLMLGNVTLSNPVIINNGTATEFLQVAAGAVATFAGNSSLASNSNQYRIGFADTTAYLMVTGTGNAGSATTVITRGNISYQGNASLTGTNAIILGRSASTSVLTLNIQDNAALHFNGVLLAGNNSSSDAANSNITLSGNGTLDAGTGVFNLNDSGSNGNATLTTNDNSTIRAGSFSMTGSKIGTAGTFWLVNTGGNLVATTSNANFLPANSKLTIALAANLNIDDGGFNIGISQPFIDFGGGSITKLGNGSLSLSGANGYSGTTTVAAGSLYADNATSPLGVGSSAVVNAGATLGGIGTVTQAVSVSSGGHIAPGDGGVTGNLTLSGGLTLATSATLDFNFKPDGSANSLLALTSGGITASGTIPIDLYQAGSTTPFGLNGTYDLIHFGSGFVATTLSVADPVGGATYTFSNNGTDLFVTIAGGFVSTAWGVDSNGSWGTGTNWTAGIPNGAGAFATFGSIITAPRTVTLDGSKTVGAIAFNNASAYTIAQGSGGSLIIDNGGANGSITSNLGSHFITAPVVLNSSVNMTVANLTDTLTVSGAISGAGNLSMGGLGTLVLSGANSYAGTTSITGGTLQLATGGTLGAGNVTNSASLVVNSSSPVTISNNISGNGTVTQSGTGTLVLSGTNSYTGATILNAGTTVQAGSATALGSGNVNFAGAGTVDLHGNSLTVGTLTGTGTFDNQLAASNSTLTLTNAANATISSSLVNTAGSLALVKNGAGTLTFSGTNSFSGGTTISAGVISVTSNTTLGSGPIAVNAVVGLLLSNGVTLTNNIVNGIPSTEFEDISTANGTATLSGTITSLAGDQYRVGVTGANATLTLTGANSAQATSVLTRGNIVYAGNGSLTVTATASANDALIIGRTAGTNLNLTIQDNASVSSNNGITLDGNGSSSDSTTTTVTLNGNGSLISAGLPLNVNDSTVSSANVTLSLNGTSQVVTAGFVSSHTTPVKINLNGGSIVASAADPVSGAFFPSLTNVSATVLAGGVTINDGGFAITIAQPLVDPTGTANGGLTKTGAGSLTLTAANTYSGNTNLTGGKLLINNTTGSGTGPGSVILNGGTLGGTGTIAGAVLSGSGAHTINPGTSTVGSVGKLTIGSLVSSSNTTLAFDLASPTGTSDMLAVTGNLNISAGVHLAITSQTTTGTPSLGYYKVLSYGSLTGSVGNVVLPAVANNIAYTVDTTHDVGFVDVHRGYIGDATDDGKVDLNDLNTVLNNLGVATLSWNNGNFDGAPTIDLNDLNDVLNNLGTSIPSGANVVSFSEGLLAASPAATPEPTSLGILALGAGALLTRRRKA